MNDMVNSPKHYEFYPDMDAIEVIRRTLSYQEHIGYLKGNAPSTGSEQARRATLNRILISRTGIGKRCGTFCRAKVLRRSVQT